MAEQTNEDTKKQQPDESPVALLLIDVINDLEWEGGEKLLPAAEEAARRLAELKKRAKAKNIPIIYVNDNFGLWQSDFSRLVEHLLEDNVRGEPIARLLHPEVDDYFVLKPLHSAFYATTLSTLLNYLETTTLIVTGFATDICVLFTANDAYMRGFKLYVPADCVAANEPEYHEQALALMERVLKADLTPSIELDLDNLAQRERDERASVAGKVT